MTEKLAGLFGKVKEVEQEVPPMEDPGKDYRSASGLPIVPAFDGFRALAIMTVVVSHLLGTSGRGGDQGSIAAIFYLGTFGRVVEVLFVVSGFVVFLPTVARGGVFGPVGPYALRRVARLLPAYWLLLLLVIIVAWALPQFEDPTGLELISNFSFMQKWVSWIDPGIEVGFGLATPVWTLSIEITFYLVLPLVAAWYARRPLVGLFVAMGLVLAWHQLLSHTPDFVELTGDGWSTREFANFVLGGSEQFPHWILSFAAGMTAAWLYVRFTTAPRKLWSGRTRGWIAIAAIALFICFSALAGINADQNPSSWVVLFWVQPWWLRLGFTLSLAAAMLAISLAPRWIQFPFSNRPVRKLGDISYGVYLVHYPLLLIAIYVVGIPLFGDAWDLFLLCAFVIPLSLLYGYLSARFVEQPIRRWAHRFGARAQSGQTPRNSA